MESREALFGVRPAGMPRGASPSADRAADVLWVAARWQMPSGAAGSRGREARLAPIESPRARVRAPRSGAALVCGLVVGALAPAEPAAARPEVIRAGVSYYSDERIERGPVRDIGAERNYEEVFKNYTYYEVRYDERERVVRFREYERGELIRTDHYRYAEDGAPGEHVIEIPGQPAQTAPLEAPAPSAPTAEPAQTAPLEVPAPSAPATEPAQTLPPEGSE